MLVFQNYPVYQNAPKLYQEIVDYLHYKKTPEYLKDQLKKALSSIGLNIATGSGKMSRKDKKNFHTIAEARAMKVGLFCVCCIAIN